MKNFILTILVLISTTSMVMAQDVSQERGFVSFDNLEAEYGEPKVMVDLNQAMLGFVSKLNVADQETSELISKLKAVRVKIYNIESNEKPALELMSKVTNDIKKKSWMPIVTINEEHEKVRVFTKLTNEIMDGLVVMVINDNETKKEAVFINIIGEIDPAQINKVTKSLNIEVGI